MNKDNNSTPPSVEDRLQGATELETTNPAPYTKMRRYVQNPILRFFVMFVVITILYSLVLSIAKQVGDWYESPLLKVTLLILGISIIYLIYILLVRAMESRKSISELSTKGAFNEFIGGVAIGSGLISLSVFILWVPGFFVVEKINDINELFAIRHLPMTIGAGFVEELLFRAILFRLVEEKLGSWAGIIVSSLFFGLAHAANPNATWFSSFAIAMEAGVLLGAAYIYTQRLWFPIGIHIAWNYTQGAVFGIAVSGGEVSGFLSSRLEGDELISGGAFGAEASMITLLVCSGAGIYFLWKSNQSNLIIPPYWKRPMHVKL